MKKKIQNRLSCEKSGFKRMFTKFSSNQLFSKIYNENDLSHSISILYLCPYKSCLPIKTAKRDPLEKNASLSEELIIYKKSYKLCYILGFITIP